MYGSRDGLVQQVLSSCPNMSRNKKECGGGYGNYITIKHANGVYSRYAHLDTVSVKVGQKVTAGQKIATMGTSDRVGAVHLHFEIRQNIKGMATGGWNPLDKERFYYILPKEIKSAKIGWLKEGDKGYYLDNNGVIKTGWINIGNKWYYLGNDEVMQVDWLEDDDEWYYLNSDGSIDGFFSYINSLLIS